MIKPKWKRRTGLMAAALLSALSLPGFAVQATETLQVVGSGSIDVSVGGSGDVSDGEFTVPVSIWNPKETQAEIRIEDLEETDGTKIIQTESAVFYVDGEASAEVYMKVPGDPRMVSATVKAYVDGMETDSSFIQFSDMTAGNVLLKSGLSETVSAENPDKRETSSGNNGSGVKETGTAPTSGSVVEVPENHTGMVVAIVVGVVAVISIAVVWLVLKKKKGRDAE